MNRILNIFAFALVLTLSLGTFTGCEKDETYQTTHELEAEQLYDYLDQAFANVVNVIHSEGQLTRDHIDQTCGPKLDSIHNDVLINRTVTIEQAAQLGIMITGIRDIMEAGFISLEQNDEEQMEILLSLVNRLDMIEFILTNYGDQLDNIGDLLADLQATQLEICIKLIELQASVDAGFAGIDDRLDILFDNLGGITATINMILTNTELSNLTLGYIYDFVQDNADSIDDAIALLNEIKQMMIQALANQASIAAQNNTLIAWTQSHSAEFNALVAQVGGIAAFQQTIYNGVLLNGQGISEAVSNSANNGVLLGIVINNQGNIQQGIADAIAGISQNNASNAAQTALLNSIIQTLGALGNDLTAYATTIINGISNLQLGQSDQNVILGQLLANSNNLVLVANQILDYVETLPAIAANINGIAINLANHTAAFDAFAAEVLNRLDVLQLSVNEIASNVVTLIGYAQQQIALSNIAIAKIDALQLSVNDLHDLQLTAIDHLVDIKVDIANLEGAINGVTNLVLSLTDITVAGFNNLEQLIINIEDNLCCNDGCGSNGGNITITNVINTVINNCPSLPTGGQQQNCLNNAINVCQNPTNINIEVCPVIGVLQNVNNSGNLQIGNGNINMNNSSIGSISQQNGC